ncbi:MAG: carbamate kinase [Desulfurococcales archaeon]|nr:carbamate kinase [Desulfurococcales archaeon]
MRAVIALGGNALLRKGEKGSPEEMWKNVRNAAIPLARIVESGVELSITHGNGPQVGLLLEAFSCSTGKPQPTLDMMVAMTQGWLGYMIQHALEQALSWTRRVAVLTTRVVVSRSDPAFKNPTKYVGSYYSEREAKLLAERKGWVMKPDPRGGWRRVVPSPKPLRILESPIIKNMLSQGYIVVSVGGGGIPVDEDLNPVEAVIDKDRASSVLAREIDADLFVILTDVPGIAVNFRKPGEKWLHQVNVDTLEELYRKGEFPPGSMGPKVEAVIDFVRETGRRAAIGLLEEAYEVFKGRRGTQILP